MDANSGCSIRGHVRIADQSGRWCEIRHMERATSGDPARQADVSGHGEDQLCHLHGTRPVVFRLPKCLHVLDTADVFGVVLRQVCVCGTWACASWLVALSNCWLAAHISSPMRVPVVHTMRMCGVMHVGGGRSASMASRPCRLWQTRYSATTILRCKSGSGSRSALMCLIAFKYFSLPSLSPRHLCPRRIYLVVTTA